MISVPRITVAPNGARLQKTDHEALPVTAQELAETARNCQRAGANCIHLHVRDAQGTHSLNADLYRGAIAAVSKAAPGLQIQVTTEAAGRFGVAEQLHLLRDLQPEAASIAIREIARAPELARQVYATAQAHQTQVQHILYRPSCLAQLEAWRQAGIVPSAMRDAILVLGQYSPPRPARPADLEPLLGRAQKAGFSMTICAFGPDEQACLIAAASFGCDLRIGFENNIFAPDGSLWADNAGAVASLKNALNSQLTGATL